MNFFNQNLSKTQKITLSNGEKGLVIKTKQIVNGKTVNVGGYWTENGKLITFWD